MLALARFEALFWVAGLSCLGYCISLGAQANASREAAREIGVERIFETAAAPRAMTLLADGDLMGTIEIPAPGLMAPIAEGYDADTLRKGVGHIRGTAMPGGLGTVGLAGHRDSFFRPLRDARPGMEIRLTDRTGTYRYALDSSDIVTPERVDVLDAGTRPGLRLLTCYPFDYVGAAPKRFIVHAHLISVVPEHKRPPR
jgi:sortase A